MLDHTELARGHVAVFPPTTDTLGRCLRVSESGSSRRGSARRGRVLHPEAEISSILSPIVYARQSEPATGVRKKLESVFDFACGSGRCC